jgi:5'-nucleotidase
MWHSGTLAGAKQAALMGSRGIALSAPSANTEPDFERLKPHVAEVLRTLLPDSSLPLVNVNFPLSPRGTIWTRQSVRHYDGKVVPIKDPMGRQLYWFTVVPMEETEEGTDRWAIEHGLSSVTPLRLDLTDGPALERAQSGKGGPSPSGAGPGVPEMWREPHHCEENCRATPWTMPGAPRALWRHAPC